MIRIFDQYVSTKGVALFVVEIMLIILTRSWAAHLRFWNDPVEYDVFMNSPWAPWPTVARVIIFQICFFYADLYSPGTLNDRLQQWAALSTALGSGTILLALLQFFVPGLLEGRGVFVLSLILLILSVVAVRILANAVWGFAQSGQRILILGSSSLAEEVARELDARNDLGGRIMGVLSGDNGAGGAKTTVPFPVLGTAAEVEKVAQKHGISRVIVALEDRRGILPVRALLRLRFEGIPVEDAHDTLAALNGRVSLKTIQPSWFIFSEGFHRSRLNLVAKRISDLIFGTVGLILALPIMAGVALAVVLDSGRPIIYRQQRVGLHGRTFDVLKFRSMRTDAEKSGKPQWAAAGDPRVTRIGKYLRKFRFDELPQFINIIRGEMSFVGPRPERPAFVEQLRNVIPYYDERHRVRPGLTGWAQVQYSYGSSEEDAFRKLEYDLFYLKNMSITFDLMIVAKTLRIIATGEGAR